MPGVIDELIPEPIHGVLRSDVPIPCYATDGSMRSQVVWVVKWHKKVLHDVAVPESLKRVAALALDDMPLRRVFTITLQAASTYYDRIGYMQYGGNGLDAHHPIVLYMSRFDRWALAAEVLIHEFGHFYHYFYLPGSLTQRKRGTRKATVTNWHSDQEWTNARVERFAETYARYGMIAVRAAHILDIEPRSLRRWLNLARTSYGIHQIRQGESEQKKLAKWKSK